MRVRPILLLLLGAAAVTLALLPWLRNREDRDLDAAERERLSAAGHTFASLSQGVTHYQLTGPADGPLVVLIHGTSGPMQVWDETVPALNAAGYRTLRYDLYGRGASERIDEDHNLDLYVTQVDELITAVADRPALVIGSSLGAVIASGLAIRAPDRVKGVVLIGPAGFPLEASPLARLTEAPLIGDYLMTVLGDAKLADHQRNYFVAPERFESHHKNFAEQLRYRGSKAAILSTLRHAPLQSFLNGYQLLGHRGVPALVLWGEQDHTFPISHRADLEPRLPHAEYVDIALAGHLPQLEAAPVCNQHIIRFAGRVFTSDAL